MQVGGNRIWNLYPATEEGRMSREVDKKHLAKIRKQPCLVRNEECFGNVVAHHTISVGAGGSDKDTAPLCIRHHSEVHTIGKLTFQKKYKISFLEYIENERKNHNRSS